jgi:hypothetical protein
VTASTWTSLLAIATGAAIRVQLLLSVVIGQQLSLATSLTLIIVAQLFLSSLSRHVGRPGAPPSTACPDASRWNGRSSRGHVLCRRLV